MNPDKTALLMDVTSLNSNNTLSLPIRGEWKHMKLSERYITPKDHINILSQSLIHTIYHFIPM